MRINTIRKFLAVALIVTLFVSPVMSSSARADGTVAGAALAPFAGFLTLGLAVAYLDATQTGPNDGPFNAMFPVVEQTYPNSGHHKGH